MEIVTNKLNDHLEMLEQTNSFLDDHIAIWTAVPIISTYKNEVHQLLNVIHNEGSDKLSPKVHSGQHILHLKKQISDKLDILDDTLEAYAEDIGNEELKVAAANYYSDYFRLPFDQFIDKVTQMITLLEKHVPTMGEYGLVQDQIDDVKLQIDEYVVSLERPAVYHIASSIAHETIEDLIERAVESAEKLDKVMLRFKRSNVTFYNGYLAARTIISDDEYIH